MPEAPGVAPPGGFACGERSSIRILLIDKYRPFLQNRKRLDETELSRRYAASARGSFELPVRMEIARNQCREAAAFCDATIDSSELERAAKELNTIIG